MNDKSTILKLQKQIDRLKKAIKKQRYGLVWMDIPEAFEDDVENKIPILKEIPELGIKSSDDKPTHILIEGDNYHALTCLNYTHKNKIDVIYIDPPYNTGSDDFRYKDKRIASQFPDGVSVPRNHPFRHSYWLSFMRKRLELSKELLKDNGVIFVSIDDNEVAQLKLLMNEIFEETNFYGCLTWVKRTKSTNSGKAKNMLQQKDEYILVYGKKKSIEFEGFKLLYSNKNRKYPHNGKLGKCRFENIEATDYGRKKRDTMKFPILGIKPRPGRRWQFGEEEARRLILEDRIEVIGGIPKKAVYPTDENATSFVPFWSHLENTGTAESGKQELNNIIGPDHGFDTVKPTGLIRKIIERFDENAIILDFFAGSGTTGHALMQLNSQDKGRRQFIIVTDNENNIMKDICYPRIRNIIQGHKKLDGSTLKGLGNSLKYYRTAFIGKNNILNATDEDKVKLAHNAGELLAIAENTMDLISQDNYFQLFEDTLKNKYTAVYFREELDQFDKFIATIESLDRKTTVYVFSWGNEEFKEEFSHIGDVVVKTIPLPILEIYKNIYNLV